MVETTESRLPDLPKHVHEGEWCGACVQYGLRLRSNEVLGKVEWCEAHEQENDRDRVDREECPDCQAAVGRWWWATRWTKEPSGGD